MRNWFRRLRGPTFITPITVRPGDDLVISLPNRLDSDDAFALLDAAKEQFSGVRIHLLTGFGQVQIQRGDGCSQCAGGNDRADPPLPVRAPARANPSFNAAKASEQGDICLITHATATRLIAVYIPPKQQGDAVEKFHVLPGQLRGEPC